MTTLRELIDGDGPLAATDAVVWALRLARRLEPLHQRGGAHGSVGPDVVVVDGAGSLLVGATPTSPVGFHSPERLAGGSISPADDTWAVVVTLYYSLTGRVPFEGDTDAEVRQKLMSSSPPPLAVFDAGDDELQGVVDGALLRERSDRILMLEPICNALENWLIAQGVPPPSALAESRRAPEPSGLIPAFGAGPSPGVPAPPARLPPPDPHIVKPKPATTAVGGAPSILDAPLRTARAPSSEIANEASTSGEYAPVDEEELVFDEVTASRADMSMSDLLPADDAAPTEVASPSVAPGAREADPPRSAPPSSGSVGKPAAPKPPRPLPPPSSPPPKPSTPPADPFASLRSEPPKALSAPPPAPVLLEPLEAERERPFAPSPVVKARGRRSSKLPLILGGAAALAAVGGAGYFFATSGVGEDPVAVDGAQPAPTVSAMAAPVAGTATNVPTDGAPVVSSVAATPPTAVAVPTGAPTSEPAASAAPVDLPPPTSSGAPSDSPEDINMCVAQTFPSGSFDKVLSAEFVCRETDPRKGAGRLKEMVVKGGYGREVTEGMREWAMLGWYELAAYATVRGACCPAGEPLALPKAPEACEAPADVLNRLESAVRNESEDVDDAVTSFRKLIYCLLRSGAWENFGDHLPLFGGEESTYKKTLKRAQEQRAGGGK